jgi:hypothetical protein
MMGGVQRLVGNAEEIAYNDPPSGQAERMVLDHLLERMVKHGRLSALQRFVQQVFDGFAVKYMASVVALLLYAAPLYFRDPSLRGTQDDITQASQLWEQHAAHSYAAFDALSHLSCTSRVLCSPARLKACSLYAMQDYIRSMRLLQNTSKYAPFPGTTA